MPLDEFTREAMEGLLRGDREIYPKLGDIYDEFEKGKIENIERRLGMVTGK